MASYCVLNTGDGTGDACNDPPSAADWTGAYASVTLCLARVGGVVAGDTIYVSNNHAHSAAGAAITWTFAHTSGLVKVISIQESDTTTATPLAGAKEETGGNFAFSVIHGFENYYYGIEFKAGAGNHASATIVFGGTTAKDQSAVFDTCTINTASTNSSATFSIFSGSDSTAQGETVLTNCTKTSGNTSRAITLNMAKRVRINKLILAGSTPPAVFNPTGASAVVTCSASDLSLATALVNVGGDEPSYFQITNCKLPSAYNQSTHTGTGSHVIECQACSTGDNNYEYYYQDGQGVIETDTTIYLTTGGATTIDTGGESTPYSLKYTPVAAYTSKAWPLCGPWISAWNATTGSRTVSLKCAYDGTVLKDCDLWIEVEYMGGSAAANTPMSEVDTSAPVVSGTLSRNILAAGSNLSDTAVAWTGTGAWSTKKTHTLSKAVTVDEQGFLRARVCLGVSAATPVVYVDPRIGVA